MYHTEYQSPLVNALALDRLDEARLIVEQGGQLDLNRHDASGRSPLDHCVPRAVDYRSYSEEDEKNNCESATVS